MQIGHRRMNSATNGSHLHIRNIDKATKRKLKAYAKANHMMLAGALKVLVDIALTSQTPPTQK